MTAIPRIITDSWQHCGLKVRGCWPEDANDTVSSRFRHPSYWMLLVVRSGSAIWQAANERLVCHAGKAGLFAPNSSARVQLESGTTSTHILFSPLPAPTWRAPYQYLTLPAIAPCTDHAAVDHLHTLFGPTWADAEAPLEARFCFDRLLWNFVRDGLRTGAIQPAPVRPGWLDDLVKTTSASCADPTFGVPDMVRLAGCSHMHLCRCLKKSDDRTPTQLLRFLRVNKATHLITHTPGITTEELIRRCGFTSKRTFLRQFQAETGQTLREARSTAQSE